MPPKTPFLADRDPCAARRHSAGRRYAASREINLDVVAEYTDAYREDAPMPPLDVFSMEPRTGWPTAFIAGIGAKGRLRQGGLRCPPGDRRGCPLVQLCSQSHPRPEPTNADKAKAVQAALRHPAGVTLSNEQIAEHCGWTPKRWPSTATP